MTQFIKAKFPTSQREYTYKNTTGKALRIGDYVDVDTPSGGVQSIEVTALLDEEPNVPFTIKPILGLSASLPGE